MTYFEARHTYLGASEMGAALRLSPYADDRQLWREKTGRAGREDQSGPMKRGSKMESVIIEEAEEQLELQLDHELDQHEFTIEDAPCETPEGFDPQWLRCHVDGIISDPGLIDPPDDGPGALECKAPGSQMIRKYIEDGLPADYIMQMQTVLFLSGTKWGRYCFLDYDPWEIHAFDVRRNDEMIGKMLPAAVKFWRCVVEDREPGDGPPPVIPVTDGILRQINDPKHEEVCERYALAAKALKEAKTERDDLKGRIAELVGEDAELAEINNILRVTHRFNKPSRKFDEKGLMRWVESLCEAVRNDDSKLVSTMASRFDPDLFVVESKRSRPLRITGINEFKGFF